MNVEILRGLEGGEHIVTRGAVNVKMASASDAIPHGHTHESRTAMLNRIIKVADNRLVVVIAAVLIAVAGVWAATRMEVDVFPDLNAPTVVVMTEGHREWPPKRWNDS